MIRPSSNVRSRTCGGFWFVGLTESYAADLAKIRDLTGLQIDELTINQRPTRQKDGDVATHLIALAARANRMDARLYELAVHIHDAQAPDVLLRT
jgi:hypothetical protein